MVEGNEDDNLGWFERPELTQKMMRIDQLMNSLKREFKKLLKENNHLKDTISSNLTRFNSSTAVKASGRSDSSETVSKLDLKSRRFRDDIFIQEGNNSPEKMLTVDAHTPTKSKKILAENEITAQFDYDFGQSWLEQSERSKSASISSEHQLQKSPLIGNQKRTKLKKSQSPRMDLTQRLSPSSAKDDSKKVKNEPHTVSQISVYEDVKPLDTTESLFTSIKEKEDQTFVSPQPKPRSKLGITKLYNVNTKLLSNGNKVKQTKLVFTTEEEKTDISSANCSNQAEIDTCDSIFNLTILNDAVVENMNTEIEDPFSSTNSSCNTGKKTSSFQKRLIAEEDGIVEIYPSALNSCIKRSKYHKFKKQDDISKKSSKISKSPKRENSVTSKVFTLKTDEIVFAPQCCSTQISLSKKADKCDMRSIQDLCTDSDTNFTFDEKNTLKKESPEHTSKAILADVSNTFSPQKSKSEKREENQSQESHAPVTETAMEDETFFSPGEHRNDSGCEQIPKAATSEQKNATSVKAKRVLINSFDQVPASKKRNPEYAYAVQSVKKKCERMELDGWSCWSCKEYYENMKLPEEELREYMKKCSRHKAKHDPEYHTPPDNSSPATTIC
ncbi:uncharacterized protein LOC117181516 isoform X2 [Belonocnema kinseyi]|uniref:uncharacterized protein LOC117181516 isoform X2 n=1 Tax=Belonocnema kinseyi TaxID=2817044 RepID=UPI00143D57C0|nr:uncharacterized protein LOC117181516 isoform X2 [Belonocnema kinseyi]